MTKWDNTCKGRKSLAELVAQILDNDSALAHTGSKSSDDDDGFEIRIPTNNGISHTKRTDAIDKRKRGGTSKNDAASTRSASPESSSTRANPSAHLPGRMTRYWADKERKAYAESVLAAKPDSRRSAGPPRLDFSDSEEDEEPELPPQRPSRSLVKRAGGRVVFAPPRSVDEGGSSPLGRPQGKRLMRSDRRAAYDEDEDQPTPGTERRKKLRASRVVISDDEDGNDDAEDEGRDETPEPSQKLVNLIKEARERRGDGSRHKGPAQPTQSSFPNLPSESCPSSSHPPTRDIDTADETRQEISTSLTADLHLNGPPQHFPLMHQLRKCAVHHSKDHPPVL